MAITRRSLMRFAGLGAATTALSTRSASVGGQPTETSGSAMAHAAHYSGPVGRVSTATFDPGASRVRGTSRGSRRTGAPGTIGGSASRRPAPRIRHRRIGSRHRIAPGVFPRGRTAVRCGPTIRRPRRSPPGELPQQGSHRTPFTSMDGIRRRWTARCGASGHTAPGSCRSSTRIAGLHLYHCRSAAEAPSQGSTARS